MSRREITKFPADMSSSLRDLLSRLLRKSARERISFSAVLGHAWFSGSSYRDDK